MDENRTIDEIILLMQDKGLHLNNLYRFSTGGWRAVFLDIDNNIFMGDGNTIKFALLNAEKKELFPALVYKGDFNKKKNSSSADDLFSLIGL